MGQTTATTEEPTTTEDLMSWQLAINVNPCDGHDFGYYSGWWDGDESLGSGETAFTNDYVDSETMRVPVSYITIARHDGERCEMSKTWKLQDDSRSLHDYFADPDGRIYATGDGSVHDTHISSDMPLGSFAGETTDPIFGAESADAALWTRQRHGKPYCGRATEWRGGRRRCTQRYGHRGRGVEIWIRSLRVCADGAVHDVLRRMADRQMQPPKISVLEGWVCVGHGGGYGGECRDQRRRRAVVNILRKAQRCSS